MYSDGYNGGAANNTYDGAPGSCNSECVLLYKMPGGAHIVALERPGPVAVPTMNVLFYRPDPTIVICCDGGGAPYPQYGAYKVYIYSADESFRKVISVWTTGQISIGN